MAIIGGNWTYSGDPASSDKDAVRYLIGDTDTTDQLLSDEEIGYSISRAGRPGEAAAQAIDQIIMGGRLVDKQVGDLKISGTSQAETLRQVQRQLRYSDSLSASPFGGGLSVSVKDSYRDDTDIPTPAFSEGQFDHPRALMDGSGRFESGTST